MSVFLPTQGHMEVFERFRRFFPFLVLRLLWRAEEILKGQPLNHLGMKPLSFATDWFMTHAPMWKDIFDREGLTGRAKLRYLEIGTFEGRSLIWMLENVLTHRSARAVSVDPMFRRWGDQFAVNLKSSENASKVSMKRDYSRHALPRLKSHSFDIIYLDGSHSAADVMTDLVLSWRLLKVGGVLIVDDYSMGDGLLPADATPQLAVDAFAVAYGKNLEILHWGEQVVLKKQGEKFEGLLLVRFVNGSYSWYEKVIRFDDGKRVPLDSGEPELFNKYLSTLERSYEFDRAHPMLQDPDFKRVLEKYSLL